MKAITLRDYKQRILRVLIHIQENLDEELRLEALARLACFSSYHFHRVFRGIVGESLHEHIRRLRLERAAMRLKNSALPVTFVALEACYETHESFVRAFRSMFGEAPSRFRSNRRACAQAASPSGIHFQAGKELRTFQSVRTGAGSMKVKIITLEPTMVVFVRHTGPYPECGIAWDKLMTWAGPRGFLGPGARFLGVCHDDPEVTPPEKVRFDACITVEEDIRGDGEIGTQMIAGGDYAMTTHIGPYDKLGQTYAALYGHWLPRSGYDLRSSPGFEEYLNDPGGTAPEDLITDIYIPLQKR
jgi:AraC family transcriptional regulator